MENENKSAEIHTILDKGISEDNNPAECSTQPLNIVTIKHVKNVPSENEQNEEMKSNEDPTNEGKIEEGESKIEALCENQLGNVDAVDEQCVKAAAKMDDHSNANPTVILETVKHTNEAIEMTDSVEQTEKGNVMEITTTVACQGSDNINVEKNNVGKQSNEIVITTEENTPVEPSLESTTNTEENTYIEQSNESKIPKNNENANILDSTNENILNSINKMEVTQQNVQALELPIESMEEEIPEAIENTNIESISVLNTNAVIIESVILLNSAEAVKNITDATMETVPVIVEKNVSQSGLSLLAQYDSDNNSDADNDEADDGDRSDDANSVVEIPVAASKDYRSRVVEINSDSDSSNDDADSDVEYLDVIRKAVDKSIAAGNIHDDEDDDDEDDDGGVKKGRKRQPPKVKGEMTLDDLPPIQDLHITVPPEECIELGRVHSIVDQLVLVSALQNSILLDLDTVLFLEKGSKILGEVFDVLGQVADPIYCIRFNTNADIHEKNIAVGDVVYVAPKTEYTQYVILSNLVKLRGSDASWENDIEPPPRYIDYSDDEEERRARYEHRNRNRQNHADANDDPMKRARNSTMDASGDDNESMRSISPTLSIASTSTVSSSQRPYNGRGGGRGRGRGGMRGNRGFGQNYTPRNSNDYRQQHHEQQNYQNTNYNPGSWHSNYYQPANNPHHFNAGTPPPPNYRMSYPPPSPTAAFYPFDYNNQQQQPPLPQFPYISTSMPPPLTPQQQQQQYLQMQSPQFAPRPQFLPQPSAEIPPQPSPQMFVVNPYTIRPPVLPSSSFNAQSMPTTSLPPPAPPGAQ